MGGSRHDMGFVAAASCSVAAIAVAAALLSGGSPESGRAKGGLLTPPDRQPALTLLDAARDVAHAMTLAQEQQAALPDTPRHGISDAGGTLEASAPEIAASAHGIVSIAPAGFSQTKEARALDQAVAAFEENGYQLGIVLVDAETGCTLSLNASEPRYPASSIKAAFCAFVYERNGPTSEPLVADCLIESSNEAYHALIRAYGQQDFGAWLEPMAPEAAAGAREHFYPWISPREFMAVWQEIYRFCTSDEPGGKELADLLSRTNYSPWADLLRERYEVWAKPGWYPTTDERATNDCAVVFSDCGPYIAVVMSDAPEDFEALRHVLDALNAAHGRMCGGSTESFLTGGDGAA